MKSNKTKRLSSLEKINRCKVGKVLRLAAPSGLADIHVLRNTLSTLIFFILFVFNSLQAKSQNIHFNVKNKTLSEALLLVSTQLNVKIAFDSQKLSAVKITKDVSGKDANEALAALLSQTGFKYVFKYDSYLIVKDDVKKQKETEPNKYQLIASICDSENGESLPYANVSLVNEKLNISTSPNGTFNLKNNNKNVRLHISYLGYATLDTLLVLQDSLMKCKFKLNKKLLMLNQININAEKMRMISFEDDAGHNVINSVSFSNLPNLGETDVFRALQLLPGISGGENSSELNIRGGSNDQNLILLDGFTLYNLDHFFGTFSFINPNIVKDIQVYKGGFDSRYGERVSGIIDITGKSGNQMKPTIYGGINMIDGNLSVEIPVTEKLTVIAAGRRTYSDVYTTYLFDNLYDLHFGSQSRNLPPNAVILQPKYYFYDFNTKISYNLSNSEKVSFSFYSGKDKLSTSNISKQGAYTVTTNDENEWGNYGVSMVWLKEWQKSFFSNVQVGYSGYSNEYVNNTNIQRDPLNTIHDHFLPLPNNHFEIAEENELKDFAISIRNSYLPDIKHQIDFGILARNNSFTYNKNADQQYVYNDIEQSAWLYSAFVQDKYSLNSKLTFKPGVRFNYYPNTSQVFIEPRLSVSYKVNDVFLLKAATGKYFQYLNKVATCDGYGYNRDFWVLADNNTHKVLESNHFIGGFNLKAGNWLFDAEAYYKNVDGIEQYIAISPYEKNNNFRDFFPQPNNKKTLYQPSTFDIGKGTAYGLDLLLRYENSFYTGWVSYSLSRSFQNFASINRNQDIAAPFDKTHQVNWVNMFSFGKWNFSVLYLFSTGQPYIINNLINKNLQSTRTYARLPNYGRADVSVNYNINIKRLNLKLGVSVINVLNKTNYFDVYSRKFDFDNTSFSETSLVKSQNFSPNFFINFKF